MAYTGRESCTVSSYVFSLAVKENLGFALFSFDGSRKDNNNSCNASLTNLGRKLLSAYACHKYSMKRRDHDCLFYRTLNVSNISVRTDRRLVNMVILNFEASFDVGNDSVIDIDSQMISEEREYRRYVDENHPLLINVLGGKGTNDLSNLNFHRREIEILFRDYRLVIDIQNQTFTVQYKKFLEGRESFLPNILTREILYVSREGPKLKEPNFIFSKKQNYLIGIASFLESKNFAVKSLYAKRNSVSLYQRVCPDDFSKSYPFILEYEITADDHTICDVDLFFNICWRLNASISRRKNNNNNNNNNTTTLSNILPISSKPLHQLFHNMENSGNNDNNNNGKSIYSFFKKFDGIPATLIFYRRHFILRNSIMSKSYEHFLPENISYILRDYHFLVESNLYSSKNSFDTRKPKPMVIIDIQTNAFTARERMSIVQLLRNNIAEYLYEYFIFFQGESCNGVLTQHLKNYSSTSLLEIGKIYEVKLSMKDKKIISEIVKPRGDKIKPNSSRMIDLIWRIQQEGRKPPSSLQQASSFDKS